MIPFPIPVLGGKRRLVQGLRGGGKGNQAVTKAELEAIRKSVHRGSPYGGPAWTERTAKALGLESTLRPRGRPKTSEEKEAVT
jgi:hypothetical protein